MKIGIIAATGKTGQLILKEALNEKLDVTAIVRNASCNHFRKRCIDVNA